MLNANLKLQIFLHSLVAIRYGGKLPSNFSWERFNTVTAPLPITTAQVLQSRRHRDLATQRRGLTTTRPRHQNR